MPEVANIPQCGSVLGVDVGFSYERATSAVCRLDWDETGIAWTIRRFRDRPEERVRTIAETADAHHLLAAAFDGPLGPGLDLIGRYRPAEQLLTHQFAAKIGKPGQTNAPVGTRLNAAANACARTVLDHTDIALAHHAVRIDRHAVVEAFPTGFLGVMLPDPSQIVAKRNDRSDVFFKCLVADGSLTRLLSHCLPGRVSSQPLEIITNHDDRAAFMCAVAALCVAAVDYTAVGNDDGWIILPPILLTQPWAVSDLQANVKRLKNRGRYYRSGETFPSNPANKCPAT